MEQRSLERVVSQRALQIGSSFPCQICVLAFLSGVCLTSLFLVGLPISTFTSSTTLISKWNQLFLFNLNPLFHIIIGNYSCLLSWPCVAGHCNVKQDKLERWFGDKRPLSLLYSSWSNQSSNEGKSKAPHLENCKLSAQTNERLDTRLVNHTFPPWKGHFSSTPQGAYPPWVCML